MRWSRGCNALIVVPLYWHTLEPSKHLWKIRAALGAVALAAYANSFGLGLVLDAHRLVVEDARVHAATASNLRVIFATQYWYPHLQDRLYRPFTTLSFLINYAVLGNGDNPAGYHVVNFLLHALNVLLVFELARRVFAPGRSALPPAGTAPAFFAAALWAVHPVGTESVANLAGRSDLLAGLAVLGGLLLYTRARPLGTPTLAGLFAVAAMGFFSKESAVILPAMMLLWDLSFGARPGRARAYAAVLGALALALLARREVFAAAPWPEMPFVDNPLRGLDFWAARLTAIKVVGLDLGLLVWPANLAFDHSFNQIPPAHWTDPAVWLTLAVVAELLAVATMRRRRDPVLFFAAGFCGLALVPISNLVELIGSIMAVRFLYFPAVGFAIAASALAFRLPGRSRRFHAPTGALVMSLAVVLCTGRTLARNPAWQSNLALASADVKRVPASFRVHALLGSALMRENQEENLEEAIGEAEKAWAIIEPLEPAASDDRAASDLALSCRIQGDRLGGPATAAGRAWYERALDLYERAARIADARIRSFDQLQLAHGQPLPVRGGYDDLYIQIGQTYAAMGRGPEALDAFRNARIQNPVDPKAYNQAIATAAAQKNWDALAIALNEKLLVFGSSPEILEPVAGAFEALPGGGCALAGEIGALRLKGACPPLQNAFCRAVAEQAAVFHASRIYAREREVQAAGALKGCQGGGR